MSVANPRSDEYTLPAFADGPYFRRDSPYFHRDGLMFIETGCGARLRGGGGTAYVRQLEFHNKEN